jgi:RNA polymerase sigma-70 factor (ECF subfamily)
MKTEDEVILIDRIKNGEKSLFDTLVTEYSPLVLSVIRGILSNREDAEEIAQDVFVKAFFSLNNFRGDSSFSTWIYRIAYNMAISKARQKKRIFVQIDKLTIPDKSILASEVVTKEEEIQKLISHILKSLTPSDRFIIIAFYMHRKSIAEIAFVSGLSESNVKVRLHRIKKRLNLSLREKMEVSYG